MCLPLVEKYEDLSFLEKGKSYLEFSMETARAMRSQCVVSGIASSKRAENNQWRTQQDNILATELESLACRWIGILLWYKGHTQESVKMFNTAAGNGSIVIFSTSAFQLNYIHDKKIACAFYDDLMRCYTQQYNAAIVLTQLSINEAERLWKKGKGALIIFKPMKEIYAYVQLARTGYDRASKIICEISRQVSNSKKMNIVLSRDVSEELKVLKQEDISEKLVELDTWWHQKEKEEELSMLNQRLPTNQPSTKLLLARGDIASGSYESCPKASITFTPALKKRKNSRRNPPDRIQAPITNEEVEGSSRLLLSDNSTMVFRKWGDDLLNTQGESSCTSPENVPIMTQVIRETALQILTSREAN
eukprot:CAMPEP_0171297502 /NCGR_PEP_ID=MMETSP0816-20121228/6237_1 /TAXON_ID=420281 /ORGANISM="Proboscia inermis, Strain CCAP1064/1" /LENGTH=361 /DNA_ID=CAMNT_0011771811 /DNA_START=11 /DNA_END=1096 /DNA_ORIENTATION=-